MPGSVIAVVLAIRGPLLHPFFRGLRAPLLPVLDHLDADRRYRPRPDFRYEVTTHGSGADEALKVKQSAASTATVHLTRTGTRPYSTFTAAAWSSRAWSTSS